MSRGRIAEFEQIAQKAVSHLQSGHPRDANTDIGPIVSCEQMGAGAELHPHRTRGGAKLLAGGEDRPDGLRAGWFVKPTPFTRVQNRMRIAQEEIFGHVLTIIPYKNEADAIAITNDTRYGLSALV